MANVIMNHYTERSQDTNFSLWNYCSFSIFFTYIRFLAWPHAVQKSFLGRGGIKGYPPKTLENCLRAVTHFRRKPTTRRHSFSFHADDAPSLILGAPSLILGAPSLIFKKIKHASSLISKAQKRQGCAVSHFFNSKSWGRKDAPVVTLAFQIDKKGCPKRIQYERRGITTEDN